MFMLKILSSSMPDFGINKRILKKFLIIILFKSNNCSSQKKRKTFFNHILNKAGDDLKANILKFII